MFVTPKTKIIILETSFHKSFFILSFRYSQCILGAPTCVNIKIVIDVVLVHKIQLTGNCQLLLSSLPVLILGAGSQH